MDTTTPFITVTGADVNTSIGMLVKLDAEVGLLYSATPEGRSRYPRRPWIQSAIKYLPCASLHVCGRTARQDLMSGWLYDITDHVQRIQVNGILTIHECETLCAMYPKHTVITQHNRHNNSLLAVKAPNHALLVDSSGGRGILPTEWRAPDTDKPVGFAGGLGPDNLAAELERISSVAKTPWWVDVESKLRVDDWFSFQRARDCVTQFHIFLNHLP